MSLQVELALAAGPSVVKVAFEARPGITVLFGPSAAGKTLTLNAVAGLFTPRAGSVVFDGQRFWPPALPVQARGIGYAPQDGALWPHLPVRAHLTPFATAHRTAALRSLLGLDALWEQLPRRLSGGERQRVGLARALAREPKLLLFDEPLTALDHPARLALAEALRVEIQRLSAVALWVTHDPLEAERLAQQVVVYERRGGEMQAAEVELDWLAALNRQTRPATAR